MSLLEVQHLKKHYATLKAVDDISFEIPQGSIFGLLGPNGAGKSTLLRMITRIFFPDSGMIRIEGEALHAGHTEIMGYMPEERGLYKKMKIGEQVLYLARLKGLTRQEALHRSKAWFDRLEMGSWWNKKVEDLSKGMSQKLQFVTTVMHNPKLLILDEPFSGLDPVNADVIKEEIYRLAQQGTTIIFSTHRMEQVEEICNQIVLINLGKKILDGHVSQIKTDFKQNIFEIQLQSPDSGQPEFMDVLESKDQLLRFHLREGVPTNRVLQHYIDSENAILGFREILPSLNEIFIRLVKDTPQARAFTS